MTTATVKRWSNSQKHSAVVQPSRDAIRAGERPSVRIMQERRAREAAQATREYEADRRAVQTKSARLRALRLAKETSDFLPKTVKQRTKKTSQPIHSS
jgi:hypothetical protein